VEKKKAQNEGVVTHRGGSERIGGETRGVADGMGRPVGRSQHNGPQSFEGNATQKGGGGRPWAGVGQETGGGNWHLRSGKRKTERGDG